MDSHHNTIIKLSKINIAIAIASYLSLILYIVSIMITFVGMSEAELQNMDFPWWIFVTFFIILVAAVAFLFFDVIIGVYALVYASSFHNTWIPWGIAASCAVAFFISPFIGFVCMIINISFCKTDLKDIRRNEDESAGLINNTDTIVTSATVVYPIPSCNAVPPPPYSSSSSSSSSAHSYQQNQNQVVYAQPAYYAGQVQYPNYNQQRASAVVVSSPFQQPQLQSGYYGQIPTTNVSIPRQSAPSNDNNGGAAAAAGSSPVQSIYPNVSTLNASSSSSSLSSSTINVEQYSYPTYTYNYNQK